MPGAPPSPRFLRLTWETTIPIGPVALYQGTTSVAPQCSHHKSAVILSERGPRRTLQPGGGEPKDPRLHLFLLFLCSPRNAGCPRFAAFSAANLGGQDSFRPQSHPAKNETRRRRSDLLAPRFSVGMSDLQKASSPVGTILFFRSTWKRITNVQFRPYSERRRTILWTSTMQAAC